MFSSKKRQPALLADFANSDVGCCEQALTLENLMTQTYKGYHEYTELDHIRICNHSHPPPSFRLEGSSLRIEGKPPVSLVFHVSNITHILYVFNCKYCTIF